MNVSYHLCPDGDQTGETSICWHWRAPPSCHRLQSLHLYALLLFAASLSVIWALFPPPLGCLNAESKIRFQSVFYWYLWKFEGNFKLDHKFTESKKVHKSAQKNWTKISQHCRNSHVGKSWWLCKEKLTNQRVWTEDTDLWSILQPIPSPREETVEFCGAMGSLSSITKFTAAFFLMFQSVSDLEHRATGKQARKNITLCLHGD